MVADPKKSGSRSNGRSIFALVVGVVFLIGLIQVLRWVGSLLGMAFFIVIVAAVVAIVLIARRR